MCDRRILFFGDSLVAGVGDPEGLGWVGRLVRASHVAGLPITPYNLGVRRETSVEIGARWQSEAAPRLTQLAECKVVFSFGANDTTMEAGRQRVEPHRSIQALDAVLDRSARLGLATLIVGPAPVDDGRQTERIAALSGGFRELCEGRSIKFVEMVAELRGSSTWRREVQAGDGAHPGAAGYQLFADLMIRAGWLEWLEA